ncbi:MAG: hypothetical protein J7K84_10700 [Deltaproteobacteria bacterium]|nr:hypothetical protein [Deltaproteobacteria bacterium]
MGYLKQKQIDLEKYLSGTDALPALNGGYLYIYKNKKLLHIASIPSPNLLGDNYRQSLVENDEYFSDEDGNEFTIDILSSNVGVDWHLTFYPDDENIIKSIRYKVKQNEF